MKLSGLQAAEEIHEQDMQDPEYRREYERTRLATDIAVKIIQYHSLSQTPLGRKLGMSQPNVARLESAEHLSSAETLARLALVLGLDFSIDVKPDRVAENDSGVEALLLALPDVFPWVRFLPKEDVQAFLVELVETIRACASLDNTAALAPVIAAWRGTAEIYSDPELLKESTAPLDGSIKVRLLRLAAGVATPSVSPRRRTSGA